MLKIILLLSLLSNMLFTMKDDIAALKIQKAWLNYQGLLKPFYFKSNKLHNKKHIVSCLPIYKIKRLSYKLFNQKESLVLDNLSDNAIAYLKKYFDYKASNIKYNNITTIADYSCVIEILNFAQQWKLSDLKSIAQSNYKKLLHDKSLIKTKKETTCKKDHVKQQKDINTLLNELLTFFVVILAVKILLEYI